MPDLTDLTETALAAAAAEPASASVDGQSVTAHPLPDQIALAKYAKSSAAVAGANPQGGSVSGWAGLRPARYVPPGAV